VTYDVMFLADHTSTVTRCRASTVALMLQCCSIKWSRDRRRHVTPKSAVISCEEVRSGRLS